MQNFAVMNTAYRALLIPELLRNILFSLGDHHDTYSSTLVCRAWSEIALDVLWYEVDDICTLFNALVPLANPTHRSSSARVSRHSVDLNKSELVAKTFIRCPQPQDWIAFEKYSRRVKKINIKRTSVLPAQSAFGDIAKSRIQHTILPNLWSLHWFADPGLSVIFLHPGIRHMTIWFDVNAPDDIELFMRNARFFSPNLKELNIQTGNDGSDPSDSDPQPVGCIAFELATWLATLNDLRGLILPRFWITTRVFEALSRLEHLYCLEFNLRDRGVGNPLDTVGFDPAIEADPDDVFPSLVQLCHSVPFSRITPFISSWIGSSRLTDLSVSSQLLESPESFHSTLSVIADNCPLLSGLVLTCLITPYMLPPGRISSAPRITLDDLLPLQKLPGLRLLEISHALPLALTDDDFLVLISNWAEMVELCLCFDPYPQHDQFIHTAESPLSAPTMGTYPIIGLWQSIKSLRKHCPCLTGLSIFGIDDFTVDDDQGGGGVADDEPIPLPFPDLETLSFGTSSITSDKEVVAYALSQYLLPTVSLHFGAAWGADIWSPYLIYLNAQSLFPIHDELSPYMQVLLDEADPTVPNAASASAYPNVTVDEPVGVNGILDEEARVILRDRRKIEKDLSALLSILGRVRTEERERTERRLQLA